MISVTQLLSEYIMLTVLQLTKDKIVECAQDILSPHAAEKPTREMKVLYSPFNNTYFLERIEEDHQTFKEKIRIPECETIISYFGRLFPQKGVDDLLTSYALVKREHPDTLLLIGGQETSSNDLKRDAQLQEIPGRHFH